MPLDVNAADDSAECCVVVSDVHKRIDAACVLSPDDVVPVICDLVFAVNYQNIACH